MHKYYIGVDIGGTFTDVVLFDSDGGDVKVLKVPSTPGKPEEAVIEALRSLGLSRGNVVLINHATTVATNALLTRSGLPRAALITNYGFKDVLEIGRQRRAEIYNLRFARPPPLIPRSRRFTIRGRILADGSVAEDVSEADLKRIKRRLRAEGIQSVAVSLINSYVNPLHEKKVGEYLRDYGGFLFLSSEVDPEYREYERTSTTVVNAVLAPVVATYLERLRTGIEWLGSPLYVMASNGGLNTAQYAARMPISIIESGPSAGVLASAFLASKLGLTNVITFDMGGTTAKAGAIVDGKPDLAYEFEAAGKTHSGRSIKGSGYAVRFPFIDLAEVSAGGGTIAWIDEGGSLKVGPASAGADPGPAAYGRGGTEPTVTDANIVLGRLNGEYLLQGAMKIHGDLAAKAIEEKIGKRLAMDATGAAVGIVRLIDNSMARAISIISVERGRDPRDFSMVAFGGAGPVHACDLAEEMGIKEIIVPEHPGLFSAYGLLTVDVTRVFSASALGRNLADVFSDLRRKAIDEMRGEGFSDLSLEELVDMRYKGQSFEITINYGEGMGLREAFEAEHKRLYGYSSSDPVEAVTAKVVVRARVPKLDLPRRARSKAEAEPIAHRRVYFPSGFADAPIYDRSKLFPGFEGVGPTVVEGYDSTVVVNSGWRWEVDDYMNLVLRR